MKLKNTFYAISMFIIDSMLIIYFLLVSNNNKHINLMSDVGVFFIVIGLSIFTLISIMFLLSSFEKPWSKKVKSIFFEEAHEYEFDTKKYINDLKSSILFSYNNSKDSKQTDILGLMLNNMAEIRDYYIISKKQAQKAFTLAISLCITGFLFIIAAIVLIFVLDKSITVSVITAIGGVITEIVAGTALVVYKYSLEQLNNYYESLHNNERFLSLVNLVGKISDKKQDEAYMNIINVELHNYRNKITK